jgi:hypothetical protein
LLIEPNDLRQIRKRYPRTTPKQRLFLAYANLIVKHFAGGCRVFPAQTTNSVYVALPGSEHMIRISDHHKIKADIPTHIFPEQHQVGELANRLDRAIRAAYCHDRRDIPGWDQLQNVPILSAAI